MPIPDDIWEKNVNMLKLNLSDQNWLFDWIIGNVEGKPVFSMKIIKFIDVKTLSVDLFV